MCAESVFVQKKLGALDNRPVGPAIANNNALIYPCELKDNAYIHPLWMQKKCGQLIMAPGANS